MDCTVMPQCPSETHVIRAFPSSHQSLLYVDSRSRHTKTELLKTAEENIRPTMMYLSPNATHLIQPWVSFIIQKINRSLTTLWETHRMNMIMENKCKDGSGRLRSPQRTFYCTSPLVLYGRLVKNEMRTASATHERLWKSQVWSSIQTGKER